MRPPISNVLRDEGVGPTNVSESGTVRLEHPDLLARDPDSASRRNDDRQRRGTRISKVRSVQQALISAASPSEKKPPTNGNTVSSYI